LMDYLDGEDLACIGKTSRIGRQYAASTIFRRVFALFRWELRSYDNFVEILEQTGSVIGGLAALCILFPEFGGPASHVHIYAPRATHGNVVDYLVSEEGFGSEVVDPDPEKTGLLKHMDGVLSVVRVTKGDVMLDIVQSRNSSPLFPITSEWCSGLFNYIASRSYMSAYAPLNRDSRILLSPSRLLPGNAAPEGVRRSMLFWRRSGWEIALHWRQWCGGAQNCDGVNSLGCAAANRYFGDRFCVWGSTRAIGEPTESGGRDPSETVTVAWWRGGRTCRDACSR
ncbi:hypothetical protein OH76DRAFT_1298010, partial [Lentinus brumalis]